MEASSAHMPSAPSQEVQKRPAAVTILDLYSLWLIPILLLRRSPFAQLA
jgi:hypothetical protein